MSDEKLEKKLQCIEFKDPKDYTYLLLFTVRETIKAVKNKEMSKGSGLRLLTRIVDVAPKILEISDLADQLAELEAQINEA